MLQRSSWVVAMTLASFTLCQDLTTGAGNPPIPSGQEVLEEWCGDARSRWVNGTGGFAPFQSKVEFPCANFGGTALFTPTVDFTGFTEVMHGIVSANSFNLTGKQVYFEADPYRSRMSYLYADIFEDKAWPYNYLSIWAQRDTGNATFDRIDFLAGDGNTADTEFRDTTYFPDGIHRWWRFWHDATTNEFGIDTGASCGEWTNKVTRSVSTWSNVKIALAAEGYSENVAVERASAWFGTLYVADYPGGGA